MQLPRRSAWLCGVFALAMSFTCYPTAAQADFPSLQITYPADGLVFSVGQPVTIQWTGGDPEGSVIVDLIDMSIYQVVVVVAPDAPNNGRIDWAFPPSLVCGHTYEFYIQDAQPAWVYGQPFTVECPLPSR